MQQRLGREEVERARHALLAVERYDQVDLVLGGVVGVVVVVAEAGVDGDRQAELWLRDNNGNEFEAAL